MAEPTPLQRVVRENAGSRKVVEDLCKKWAERTKNDATPWPSVGTLAVPMLVQMEEKIRNHKKTQKGERRQAKREMELEVLREFVKLAKQDQEEQEAGKEDQRGRAPHAPREGPEPDWPCEEGERPPPYAHMRQPCPRLTEPDRLYPMVPKLDESGPYPLLPEDLRPQWAKTGRPYPLPGMASMCVQKGAKPGPGVHISSIQLKGPPGELVKMAGLLGGDTEDDEGGEVVEQSREAPTEVHSGPVEEEVMYEELRRRPEVALTSEYPGEGEAREERDREEQNFREEEEREFLTSRSPEPITDQTPTRGSNQRPSQRSDHADSPSGPQRAPFGATNQQETYRQAMDDLTERGQADYRTAMRNLSHSNTRENAPLKNNPLLTRETELTETRTMEELRREFAQLRRIGNNAEEIASLMEQVQSMQEHSLKRSEWEQMVTELALHTQKVQKEEKEIGKRGREFLARERKRLWDNQQTLHTSQQIINERLTEGEQRHGQTEARLGQLDERVESNTRDIRQLQRGEEPPVCGSSSSDSEGEQEEEHSPADDEDSPSRRRGPKRDQAPLDAGGEEEPEPRMTQDIQVKCPVCNRFFKGEKGYQVHRQRATNERCRDGQAMCYVQAADGSQMVMIPPALIALGFQNITKIKKGVGKGLSTIRRGMTKGLNEIESGVKKGLDKTKKELQKEEKEGKKVGKRARDPRDTESDEDTYTMAPLIVKGKAAHYQPWTHTDVEGLIQRLPVLQEGAGAWITSFENETVGKTLALGDIKFVLSKILGKAEAESALYSVSLHNIMDDPSRDSEPFDDYRSRAWKALRQAYPNRYTPGAVCVEKLKDEENPVAFVEKATQLWRARMEQDPDATSATQAQFRLAVMNALPKKVKAQLEGDWRLGVMTKGEFRTAVAHFVTLYRREQEEKKQIGEEAAQKLIQIQIQDAKAARKAAIQAPVLQTAASPPQPAQTGQPTAPAPTAPQEQVQDTVQQAQVIQQVLQNMGYGPNSRQGQWSSNRPRGGRQGGQGQRISPQNSQDGCFNCGGIGHMRRDCPTRPIRGGQQPRVYVQLQQDGCAQPFPQGGQILVQPPSVVAQPAQQPQILIQPTQALVPSPQQLQHAVLPPTGQPQPQQVLTPPATSSQVSPFGGNLPY